MTEASEIRKYMKLLEGEQIPAQQYTLAIDASNYELFHFILKYVADKGYTSASDIGDDAFLFFYSDQEYEKAQNLLSKMNIPFKEVGQQTEDDSKSQTPMFGQTNRLW